MPLIFLVNIHGFKGCSFQTKKGITIVNAFQMILNNSTKLHLMKKPNKLWIDKGS